MNPSVSAITLGVKDLNRARQFYSEGLGWPIAQDYGEFVSFTPADGSSAVTLYTRDALANDAGVPANGNGFSGVTFSYFVRSDDRVDAVLAEAKAAGGTIVKRAEHAQWGGYSGYFSDLDGYLWKVVTAGEGQPIAE